MQEKGHRNHLLMVIDTEMGSRVVDISNHALEALLWSHGMFGVKPTEGF